MLFFLYTVYTVQCRGRRTIVYFSHEPSHTRSIHGSEFSCFACSCYNDSAIAQICAVLTNHTTRTLKRTWHPTIQQLRTAVTKLSQSKKCAAVSIPSRNLPYTDAHGGIRDQAHAGRISWAYLGQVTTSARGQRSILAVWRHQWNDIRLFTLDRSHRTHHVTSSYADDHRRMTSEGHQGVASNAFSQI